MAVHASWHRGLCLPRHLQRTEAGILRLGNLRNSTDTSSKAQERRPTNLESRKWADWNKNIMREQETKEVNL
jgi:hypothetical protein